MPATKTIPIEGQFSTLKNNSVQVRVFLEFEPFFMKLSLMFVPAGSLTSLLPYRNIYT
jgi:hypothetical protein